MIVIQQITLPVKAGEKELGARIRKELRLKDGEKLAYKIARKSLDARRGHEFAFHYMIYAYPGADRPGEMNPAAEEKLWTRLKNAKGLTRLAEEPGYRFEKNCADRAELMRPIVVGFGPAGMFAALLLARCGLKPIVLERGKKIDERTADVERFFRERRLNPDSNVQFGEGGAGTFSDGKLATMVKDREHRSGYVLEAMVRFGAPEEILYENKPHVGTDRLKQVVKGLREEVEALGGSFFFETKVTALLSERGRISGVRAGRADGTELELTGPAVFLGIGHSARDTFLMLAESGLTIEKKPFAVGVRAEHPQKDINATQYREYADCPNLSAADYKLTYQTSAGRGVYSFCMCPGGHVIAAASEEGGVVTNGMSDYARDGENANSALLVTVNPSDYAGCEARAAYPCLAGVEFQRELERAAYKAGGENYSAPAQRVGDFLENRPTLSFGSVRPSYPIGVKGANLRAILPAFVGDSIAEAISAFDRQLAGFANPDAVLTGIESRSSSPVRLCREEDTMEAVGFPGLYPIGEGAGYAGGIMSAAMDGMKAVEKFIEA